MKNLISILLLLVSINGFSQVIADPAVSQMNVTTLMGTTLNVSYLPNQDIIRLKIPVFNKDFVNGLPSGTCKVKIGLGSKLIIDPAFDLNTVNTSNYFHWTAELYNGQIQITGDLVAPLPSDFSGIADFNVKGSVLGSSTITTNFLVTNHNTNTILSDEDPTNNTSFLAYTIVEGTIPVRFTKLTAAKEGCTININFDAETEINVNKYNIELSKDGFVYTSIGELTAANLLHYKYSFQLTDNNKAPVFYIRIRSVDNDGKYQYSETRTVKGICDEDWGAGLYPNPVSHNADQVVITATSGLFNGIYNVSLLDMSGKLLQKKYISLVNTKHFNYYIANLAAGQYIVQLMNNEGTQSAVLKLQKL